jgi:hypothetical protein
MNLHALGYVPGQNVVFEYRHADGKPEKFESSGPGAPGKKSGFDLLPPPRPEREPRNG